MVICDHEQRVVNVAYEVPVFRSLVSIANLEQSAYSGRQMTNQQDCVGVEERHQAQ